METQWIPGVNHAKRFGRWQFIELTNANEFRPAIDKLLKGEPATK
jgi:hypothetical protein